MRSGVILAGGRSSRLGVDKSLLQIGKRTMLEHVMENISDVIDEAIVVARDEEQGKAIISKIGAVDIAYDSIPGYGPVAGMLAGLKKARYEHVIALACDMPFINSNVVSHLFSLVEGYDAVVPRWPDSRIEPLHAVYDTEKMARACEKAIEGGKGNIVAPLSTLRTYYISIEEIKKIDPELRTFININTANDLEVVRSLFQKPV
ncbi:MAG: molybdenum cofactor guanylyltransferase [Methanosarcinales archaeon]|nr:MAG: molybdenum cofactor guanylyltransferase [Methanosarcinales archaeon]